MKHIASCSFGKDSVATVILAKEHGEPLDEVVYCEVMFDDNISGEVPEHRDFIYNIAIPKFEEWGIKVVVLRDQRTYISSFMRIIQKGPRAGRHKGFPLCGRCAIQRDCKLPPINKYKRQLAEDTIQYIGYAKDEQERLIRLDGKTRISLLEKYGIEEDDTFEICRKHGLLSPIYEFTDRGGVFLLPQRERKGTSPLIRSSQGPVGPPSGASEGPEQGDRTVQSRIPVRRNRRHVQNGRRTNDHI